MRKRLGRLVPLAAAWLAAPLLWAQGAPGARPGRDAAPRLDHVIVVVRNLDAAALPYARLGFRFKPGRLHSNNLLNRHIKFRDGTELELMALAGPPGDRMARGYAELLAGRPSGAGAYVALKAADLAAVARAARAVGLPVRRSSSGPWQFLSFPGAPDASAVFFGSGWVPPTDPDSIFAHANGAEALQETWVEGGRRLEALLQAIGAERRGVVTMPDGRRGYRWGLGAGALVVVPRAGRDGPPRPLGVVLRRADSDAAAPARPVRLPDGLWVTFEDRGARASD